MLTKSETDIDETDSETNTANNGEVWDSSYILLKSTFEVNLHHVKKVICPFKHLHFSNADLIKSPQLSVSQNHTHVLTMPNVKAQCSLLTL